MEDIQEQPGLPQIEKIRAVNHHLRAAIDRVSDGVLIIEADPLQVPGPRVVFINHAGRRITGYRAEDILGQPIGMIYDPAKLNDFIDKLIIDKQIMTFSFTCLAKDYIFNNPFLPINC